MDRAELRDYLAETYAADAEFPWSGYPNYMVFRHRSNRKWFAVVMDVPKEKLGLREPGVLDLLNVKCDPMLLGSFRAEPGIYPAYHMSKATWLSVALDGRVDGEKIKLLLAMSYDLTAKKVKKRGAPPQR